MKEKLQQKILNLFDALTTAKFFIMLSSTILLMAGKLDQGNWCMVVLTVAGLHEASNITGMIKGANGQQTQVTVNNNAAE